MKYTNSIIFFLDKKSFYIVVEIFDFFFGIKKWNSEGISQLLVNSSEQSKSSY